MERSKELSANATMLVTKEEEWMYECVKAIIKWADQQDKDPEAVYRVVKHAVYGYKEFYPTKLL